MQSLVYQSARRNEANGPDDITYRIARTREDRCASFRLVYRNYVEKGLIQPNPDELRVTPYHLLPTTNIFLAESGGQVISTVTLIGDNELGLPMDVTNHDVVSRLRLQGCSIAEVSCLATRRIEFRSFLPIFVKLTRLMTQHARLHGIDRFVIATDANHARFYKRILGFHQVGDEREYPLVCGRRGVACCLDFDEIDRNRPAVYDCYFANPIPEHELLSQPMLPSEIEFFAPMADWADRHVPAPV